MKKKILLGIFFSIAIFFCSISYSQIIKKNGIYFKNYKFNPDTVLTKNNFESLNSTTYQVSKSDTIHLSYIKQDFLVNTFDGDYGSDQFNVSGAMDGNGNHAFTWLDYREGRKQIYAQFYNSNDEKVGSNFKVNEVELEGNNRPFIAVNKNGDFVIVWLKNFSNVMAQRFTNNGQKVGGNFQVNSIWGMNTMEPNVSVNNDGSFLVMWASEQGDWKFQVYAKLFDKIGNPITSEIYVSEPGESTTSIGGGKFIAVDEKGNYCLTWSAPVNNLSNIYIQLINSSGELIGNNKLVSNPDDSTYKYFPEIVSTNDGHFFIAWHINGRYTSSSGIGARIYFSNNDYITDNLLISSPDNYGDLYDITSDFDSTFLIMYSNNDGPYFQKINKEGNFIGEQVKVSLYLDSNYISNWNLTGIISNNFFVAPMIYRINDANIYKQKFDFNLNPVGDLENIADDYGSAWQSKPLVKFNKNGEAIILWEDRRNGRHDLYAQVYDKNFNPVGKNIQVNDITATYWNLYDKEAVSLSDGTFVIAFSGSGNYNNGKDLLLQLVNSSGEKVGKNKWIKASDFYDNYNIKLNCNSANEIMVCYFNSYGAYLKKFDKNLSALTYDKNFLKYTNSNIFYTLAVSIDSEFNVLAVWSESNNQTYASNNKIYGEFFDETGNAASSIFIVDSSNTNIGYLKCKNYEKNYAILYKDETRIKLIRKYFFENEFSFNNTFSSYDYNPVQLNIVDFNNQKVLITYNSNLVVSGFYANDNKRSIESFSLHNYSYIDPFYDEFNGTNSADIFNGNLIFTYNSDKNGNTGYDIWANVRKLDDVNFGKENFFGLTNTDIIYPNYPNPFNSRTKIVYEILAYHSVKLTIYDVLGREVKVLVDQNQEKGLYEVEFDASNLASGIYFYRLEAFNTSVKKMILLK